MSTSSRAPWFDLFKLVVAILLLLIFLLLLFFNRPSQARQIQIANSTVTPLVSTATGVPASSTPIPPTATLVPTETSAFCKISGPADFSVVLCRGRYPELQLPERVIDWNDDHYLRYLTQRGSDAVGDLILGTAALDDYLRIRSARTLVQTSQRQVHYPELANLVMAGGLPGSSAHGEQPKFAAILQEGPRAWHVLVKFSPPADTLIGVRWSDLLVAEHLAHVHLANKGLPAVSSRILRFANRTYLEMDRFDRNQIEGRVGVTSLLAIDSQQYGLLDNCIAAATRLHRDGRLDQGTLEQGA